MRHNDVNNMTPILYYMLHFQIFDKIDSFLSNISSALEAKKVDYMTNRLIYIALLISIFSLTVWIQEKNRAKLKKLFYLNSRLRWGVQYPRYKECTPYFPISNCSNASGFLN